MPVVDPRDPVPCSVPPPTPSQAPDPVAVLGSLQNEVCQLRTAQMDFVQAELQHLRELAMLNRMSDALALHRTQEQVIGDTLREGRSILDADAAWFVIPRRDGTIKSVFALDGSVVEPQAMPLEARDIYERLLLERADRPLAMPHYDPEASDGVYFGAAVTTSEHVMGVILLHTVHTGVTSNSMSLRLLQSLLHQTAIAVENSKLFDSMGRMIVDVVIAMALAVESRDPYTGGHVLRVTGYSLLLAEHMGLASQDLSRIRLGGLLHDIGKIAVPDVILRKPGRLEPDEFAVMKTHAAVGHDIIRTVPQLAPVAAIVRHHHERYDGKGYPDQLAGQAIDPLARIVAVADTFDAMTSDRPYRKGLPIATAQQEIRQCMGTQFDPDMAAAFLDLSEAQLRAAAAATLLESRREQLASTQDLVALMDLDRPRATP